MIKERFIPLVIWAIGLFMGWVTTFVYYYSKYKIWNKKK